ncbi:MAG: tRNA (adenosine(37)-N6)-threonylcarbamoyltransferase complex dimerization subunit type 1 TsaB [Bacteroidetes bacterium]|nr:tRNA (adenosine(37)-N6)-threonylcarbamoyltransferase complex dimerization subunit type 1 TsaB [Bacteroidota bacterium]
MGLILIIETATPVCSVALCRDGQIIASRLSLAFNDHSAVLAGYIKDIFSELSFELSALDAIAVSKGPGSYTGLRIGVSTAKGLCYAMDKPLISLDTLEGMAAGMRESFKSTYPGKENTLFCPMIDARRMEVYCAVFDFFGRTVLPTAALIINSQSFQDLMEEKEIVFFGNGAEKTTLLLNSNKNALIINDFTPSAENFALLAEHKFKAKEFEDVAYFEPYYLKDFVAGKPVVKGLQ